MQIDKKKIIFFSGIIILLIIAIIFNNFKNKNYDNVTFNTVSSSAIDEPSKNASSLKEEKIKIHITGEVNNPGIIELNVGDRIDDAITLAGGLTSNADVSKTNLAYILSDGEKIYIPSVNDQEVSQETNLSSNSKININTATESELESISGVGQSTAKSIVEYRNKNRKV